MFGKGGSLSITLASLSDMFIFSDLLLRGEFEGEDFLLPPGLQVQYPNVRKLI